VQTSCEAKQVPSGSFFFFCCCGGRKEDGERGFGLTRREGKKGGSPVCWPMHGAAVEGVSAAGKGQARWRRAPVSVVGDRVLT
jgi:hypothetical protein